MAEVRGLRDALARERLRSWDDFGPVAAGLTTPEIEEVERRNDELRIELQRLRQMVDDGQVNQRVRRLLEYNDELKERITELEQQVDEKERLLQVYYATVEDVIWDSPLAGEWNATFRRFEPEFGFGPDA